VRPHLDGLAAYLHHAIDAHAPLGAVFRAVLMSCSFAEAQAIAAPVIDRLVSLDRHWDCFLSARAALTLGQPAIAAPIFRNLAPRVESESLNSWLRALCLLSRSEAALSSLPSASAPLPDAILASFYHALTGLQVSGVGGSHGRTSSKKKGGGRSFQQAFVQLRVEFLGSAFRVLACLSELPRSAFTRPSPKEIEAGRLRLASEQVARCVASLHSVALAYAHLAHCHFDIDNLSLDTLEVHQEVAQTAAWAASLMARELNPQMSSLVQLQALPVINRSPGSAQVSGEQAYIASLRGLCAGLTEHGARDSWDGWAVRLETFLRQVIRLPCSYPPFFFQARPVTDIKLAVSATVGEGVAATGGKQGLVVRVTGVLSQPPSAKRTVTHVEVEVVVCANARTGMNNRRGEEERKMGLQMPLTSSGSSFAGAVVVELWGPARYSVSLAPMLTLTDNLHTRWLHSAVPPRPVILDVRPERA